MPLPISVFLVLPLMAQQSPQPPTPKTIPDSLKAKLFKAQLQLVNASDTGAFSP